MFIKKINNKQILVNSYSILSVFGIFILANLLEIGFAIIPSSFVKIYLDDSKIILGHFIIGIITKYLVIKCLVSWFCHKSHKITIYRYKPGRTLIVCFFMLLSYRIIYNFGIAHLFDFSGNSSSITSTFNNLFNFKALALSTVLIISPIYEELLFRGIILNSMRDRYSDIVSIFVSSILFSIVHLNPIQCVNTLLIGLIFGLIYVKTESIYTVILSHIIHNILALKLPLFINAPSWLELTLYFLMIIMSILVFIKSIFYLNSHQSETKKD